MKKVLFAFAFVLVFTFTAVAQLTPDQLALGIWERRSPDGTSMIIAFRPDGSLTVSTAQVLEFAANRADDELTASVQQNGRPAAVRIRVDGDALTYSEAEVPYRWVRAAGRVAGQPAFAGVWVLDQSTQVEKTKKHKSKKGQEGLLIAGGQPLPPEMLASVRMLITPEGKVQVRLPVDEKEGAYTIQPDKMLLMYGGRVFSYAYRFADEKLYMLAQGERAETTFRRLE